MKNITQNYIKEFSKSRSMKKELSNTTISTDLISAEAIEKATLDKVVPMVKGYVDTLMFNAIYNAKVSANQEKKTTKILKDYRNKFWNKALKEADGDEKKAYKIYTGNLKEIF